MIAQIPGAVVGALLAVVFAAVYKPRGVKEREKLINEPTDFSIVGNIGGYR